MPPDMLLVTIITKNWPISIKSMFVKPGVDHLGMKLLFLIIVEASLMGVF